MNRNDRHREQLLKLLDDAKKDLADGVDSVPLDSIIGRIATDLDKVSEAMAQDEVTKLLAHWGWKRAHVLSCCSTIVSAHRALKRSDANDRGQYDAWTKTLLAVLNEAVELAE